jgi:lysophospholipase L1-like esterase
MFLGDSLTWGGYGGNFVDTVAELLPDYEIINAGVAGDTAVNIQRRVEQEIEQHQPDIAFVMVGGNDSVTYSMPKTRSYYKQAKDLLPDGIVTPEQHAQAMRDIITALLRERILTAVGIAPTEYSRELLDVRKQFSQAAKDVAEDLDVPLLDLYPQFAPENPIERDPVDMSFILQIGKRSGSDWDDYETERQKWGYTHTFDGMHLMPDAAKQMGEVITDFLKEQFL